MDATELQLYLEGFLDPPAHCPAPFPQEGAANTSPFSHSPDDSENSSPPVPIYTLAPSLTSTPSSSSLSSSLPITETSSSSSSSSSSSHDATSTPPLGDTHETSGGGEVKKQQRRQKQNLASQEYRKRKRDQLQELADKVALLTEELTAVKTENAKLKQMDASDFMAVNNDLRVFIYEGRRILREIHTALVEKKDDRQLIYLLQLFWANTEQTWDHVGAEIEKLTNPISQAKLATAGYSIDLKDSPHPVTFTSTLWWSVFCEDVNATAAQNEEIQKIKDTVTRAEAALLEERRGFDREIKSFYFDMFNFGQIGLVADDASKAPAPCPGMYLDHAVTSQSTSSLNRMVELTHKMKLLKGNFLAHKKMIFSAHKQIGMILSPRQQAEVLVRAYLMNNFTESLDAVKSVYRSINSGPFIHHSPVHLSSSAPLGSFSSFPSLSSLSSSTLSSSAPLPSSSMPLGSSRMV